MILFPFFSQKEKTGRALAFEEFLIEGLTKRLERCHPAMRAEGMNFVSDMKKVILFRSPFVNYIVIFSCWDCSLRYVPCRLVPNMTMSASWQHSR